MNEPTRKMPAFDLEAAKEQRVSRLRMVRTHLDVLLNTDAETGVLTRLERWALLFARWIVARMLRRFLNHHVSSGTDPGDGGDAGGAP